MDDFIGIHIAFFNHGLEKLNQLEISVFSITWVMYFMPFHGEVHSYQFIIRATQNITGQEANAFKNS